MVELLICLVVAVTDGDTIKVRCGEPGAFRQITVRLAEIDAPEKRQAYGTRSRLSLARLCAGAFASIQTVSTDRYGRSVARITCRGVDANREQVLQGMAWAYDRYLSDPEIKRAESTARGAQAGLWADRSPIPPWEWRAKKREGAERAQAER